MREAPSRTIIDALLEAGATVKAYDPVAMEEARRIYSGTVGLELCEDRQDTLTDSDALIVVTEWNEFMSPNFHAIKDALKSPVVFDGRNLYDTDHLNSMGFKHYAIGRGDPVPAID